MSNEIINAGGGIMVDTGTPAAKAKPAARKPAVKKAPAKAAPAKKPVANDKSTGLRKPQVRILKALLKAGRPLGRTQISQKAEIDPAMGHYLGASDPTNYEAYSKKYGFPSLLSLKYVRAEQHEGEGIVHSITAAGKAALAKVK